MSHERRRHFPTRRWCGPACGCRAWTNSDTEVADPKTETAPPLEAPAEEKSALDDAKEQAEARPDVGGAKPPAAGPCRECKRFRMLNRLRLCYPCFVDLVLIDDAKARGLEWKPGQAHPDWCSCEGLGEHPGRDHGAWRGN